MTSKFKNHFQCGYFKFSNVTVSYKFNSHHFISKLFYIKGKIKFAECIYGLLKNKLN